jgi:hypothetical protein
VWILVVQAAVAATSDCSFSADDYASLHRDLRMLRREAGRPVAVAADGEECERGVLDVLRNDPLLPVELVPRSSLERSLTSDPNRCGGVVYGTPNGYALEPLGACIDPDDVAPDGSLSTRLLSFAYWNARGATIRYNGELGYGLSFLLDAALGFPGADFATATPDELTGSHLLRGLAGIDIAARPGLRGAYVGLRGGFEGYVDSEEGTFVAETGLTHFVLGRKWIAVHGATLQLGGGVAARIPLGEGPMPETLAPVVELRVGLANHR